MPLRIGGQNDGTQPLRDLDAVRSYLSGLGPVALFDLPWIPLYLAICFAFHPLIGLTALAGAIILIALTLLTEILMRAPTKAATQAAIVRNSLAEASRRNAEALVAMGMAGRIAARWSEANRQYMHGQQEASDLGGGLGAISKVFRMLLQSVVLAVGAISSSSRKQAQASSSPDRSSARVRWRRSISPLRTGRALSTRGRAGSG
jgi:ATP-binding cassette subfamily C protein